MASETVCRNLQLHVLEADAVVVTDGALKAFAQDVIERATNPVDKGAGRLHELRVEGRSIGFGQVAIGGRHVGNAGQCQFAR
ncbi:MAG: hypothetical protein IPI89_03680 [Propionivibrio sp.]|nr:hypothetical protein [Propionivibrio sp.]